jgi:hypothetical protein
MSSSLFFPKRSIGQRYKISIRNEKNVVTHSTILYSYYLLINDKMKILSEKMKSERRYIH